MEWAELGSLDDSPKAIRIPGPRASLKQKKSFVEDVLSKFVEEYVLTEFDRDKALRKKVEQGSSSRKPDDPEEQALSVTENAGPSKEELIKKHEILPGKLIVKISKNDWMTNSLIFVFHTNGDPTCPKSNDNHFDAIMNSAVI